ncbi:MAG: ABC transporter substrate-binding protein [Betaproteobacteria bacterium]
MPADTTVVSKTRRALTQSLLALPVANAAAQPTAPAPREKVLRYAFRVAETGFDPAQVNDFYSSTVCANIFEAPLTYDFLARPAKIVPNTAAALPEVAPDYTSLRVRIRPGTYFQDHPAFKGQKRELTAHDYVYSIKRIYDPKLKSPRVYLLESSGVLGMPAIRAAALKGAKFDYDSEVEGVRALDRYTFELRFGQPNPRFYQYLADNSFLGAVAREVCESYDEKTLMAHPIGTGPFRLASYRRSSRNVLERNPGYRDDRYDSQPEQDDPAVREVAQALAGRQLPMIDRVEVYIVEENQPRWLAFLNAEHDLIDELPYDLAPLIIPNGRLAPNLVRQGIQMERSPRANVDMALFNMEHPLVGGYSADKVALRRAIGLAYQLDAEIQNVRKGQSIPAQSPVAPSVTGYDPGFRSEMSEQNRARAKALLDTYGYVDRDGDGWREQPDGSPLLLQIATQPDQLWRQLDEVWKKSLDSIGIRVQFKPAKWPENLQNSRAGKLMMWRVGWVAAQPDGDTFLALGYSINKGQANHARFSLPEFDRLYARQRELPDGPEREALFLEAKRLFAAYAPYKFLGHRMETAIWHPWLIGYRRHPFMRDFWKYVDIDLDRLAKA